jgi:2-methylcitrate dehydratase
MRAAVPASTERAAVDDLSERIATFAVAAADTAPPARVAERVTCHVVDAVGCAIAAVDADPCRIARTLAAGRSAIAGASAIGVERPSTPELAAFTNACMVRYLDYNDTYSSRSGGHPSDMVPGVLAAVEAGCGSGSDVIRGVDVAYEVFAALADEVSLRDSGWDQGPFIAVACVAGIAAANGMGVEETAAAVSLAVTTSVHLRVTRSGSLSEWKGCATAHAVMNAVFLTQLAADGMTGPGEPFCGTHGFLEQVVAPIDLDGLGRRVDGRSAVERTGLKFLPVEWAAQAPVELFLTLRDRIPLDEVEAIEISGYDFLYREIGGGRGDAAEKWDPRTRETADHSLPFLVAVALEDGAVTLDSFDMERVLDPALRPLMAKIGVVEAPGSEGAFPARQPVDVSVRLRGGETFEAHCEFSRGHPTGSAGREDVDEKFRAVAGRRLAAPDAERVLALLRGLDELTDIGELGRELRCVPVSQAAVVGPTSEWRER